MPLRRSIAVVALLAVPACTSPSSEYLGSTSPDSLLASIPQHPHVAVCPDVKEPGFARCFAHVRVDAAGQVVSANAPQGFGPSDLQSAYTIPAGLGTGKTVAIVDAQDDPNAETDLATYRAQFGLPPCTTANGCFHKVDQNGGSNYPQSDSGWGGEISLDLDMVSAICPSCNILLVETNTAAITDLGAGVNLAVSLGATAVSNSYGGSEDSSDPSTSEQFYHHDGVLITASSGDGGFGANFPASSQYVVGVGGTSLVQSTGTTRGWVEGAWDGAGSGCSQYIPKPSFQADPGCAQRTVADVSAVADPNTGVAVFDSFGQGGWIILGGTSAASPIVAATFALTGMSASGVQALYAKPSLLFDVTTGSNGTCNPAYLCTAGVGYDGPTGLGTPDATLWIGGSGNGSSSSSGSSGSSGGSGSSSGGASSSSSGSSSGGSSGSSGGASSDGGATEITLVSPDDGVTLPANSQVTLVADVTSSAAVTQVVLDWVMPTGTVQVDCAAPPADTTCTQNGDEYTWSFTGSSGPRSWSVEATDSTGTTTTSAMRSLTLGSTATPSPTTPTVTFDSPSQGATVDVGQSVSVVVEADGPNGVAQVWLDWVSEAGDQQYPLSYVGGTQWSITLPPVSGAGGSGTRTLTVTAFDPSDVAGSSTETINVP
jgi:Bacterial Ig domain